MPPACGPCRAAGWSGTPTGLRSRDYGLFENLMIACGIEASGGFIMAEPVSDPWLDLGVFERCAAAAADVLRRVLQPA